MNIRQTSDWIFRRLVLAGLVAVAGIVLFLAAAAGAYAQSGETEAAPATPDQPTGTAIWMGMMDVEWNEARGAETYEVQYFNMRGWVDLPGDGIRIAFYGAGAVVSELNPSRSYTFRVRAINSHGASEWSDFGWVPQTDSLEAWVDTPEPTNVAATGAPAISGMLEAGETLTADASGISDENGLDRVRFHYQWVGSDGTTDTDIAGATNSSYTLTGSDAGNAIKVRVSFNDRQGFAETLTSAATATVAAATGADTLVGFTLVDTSDQSELATLTEGATVTLHDPGSDSYGVRVEVATGTEVGSVSLDLSGEKSVSRTENTAPYSLYGDDGTNLDGESLPAGSYTLRATVYSENNLGGDELQTLEISFLVAKANNEATGNPTISGTARVDKTLAVDTSGIADADGLSGATFSYQWVTNSGTADTDITDATDSTYTLVAADEGMTIKVMVSFTDDAGNEESLTSAATIAVEASTNHPAEGGLKLSGMAEVGQAMRVVGAGSGDHWDIHDADGLTNAAYFFQWIRSDGITDVDIPDATDTSDSLDSSYTLADADEGKYIKVRVSFTDDAGNKETLTSSPTTAVTARPSTSDLGAASALMVRTWSEGEEKGIELNWTAPEGTITGYQILRLEKPNRFRWWTPYAYGCTPLMEVHVSDTGGDATTYTDTDVAEGAIYTYGVRAINSNGIGRKSSSSTSIQYRPPTLPPALIGQTGPPVLPIGRRLISPVVR